MSSATGPVTLLLTALVNSRELLERAEDDRVQRILEAHHKLLKNAVVAHGGQEVKWLGDGALNAGLSSTHVTVGAR
jgi:class 3 adenylate cyclase